MYMKSPIRYPHLDMLFVVIFSHYQHLSPCPLYVRFVYYFTVPKHLMVMNECLNTPATTHTLFHDKASQSQLPIQYTVRWVGPQTNIAQHTCKSKCKKTLYQFGQCKQYNISPDLKWELVAGKSMYIIKKHWYTYNKITWQNIADMRKPICI